VVINKQRRAAAAGPIPGTPPATPQFAALSGAPGVQAQPTPDPRRTVVVAEDALFEGNVSGPGELEMQIHGAVKGDVRVDHVVVGEGAHVEGGIYAKRVEVCGNVTGTITATQVRLHSGCNVDGDIAHVQMSMEIGALFQGRSLRLQGQGQATAATPKSEQAPEGKSGGDARAATPAEAIV
jgi:cytoskeletal protein CcmA (bactofilin family)